MVPILKTIFPTGEASIKEMMISAGDMDFRRGYGFGVKLSSGARQLRVEFSWGDDSKFSEPRLGVSLTGQF